MSRKQTASPEVSNLNFKSEHTLLSKLTISFTGKTSLLYVQN